MYKRVRTVRTSLSQPPKKPLAVLQRAISKKVSVRLKSEYEYRGKMSNIDQYMNVLLLDAEEYRSGSLHSNFGKVVIRGNNVLYIKIDKDF